MSIFTKPFEEYATYVVIRQIALALQNLHKKQILHLNIKDSNILICLKKENEIDTDCANLPIEFKLAGFGAARDLSSIANLYQRENVVYHRDSSRFMAPEQNID